MDRNQLLTAFTESAAIYDLSYEHFDFAAASGQLRTIIGQHIRRSGTTLLDVACGTGAYLTHLRDHYAVEGVDLSKEMLEIARRKLPGVPLHQGDLVGFDLGRQFDVAMCLGSSIGYAKTVERLGSAVATLARHTLPGGVVVVEPWFSPDIWEDGRLTADLVDRPDLKIARVLVSGRIGQVSTLDIHHLVASPVGVEYFVEHHELGLFTHDEYLAAFQDAGLDTIYLEDGLLGRGLYVGVLTRTTS